MSAQQQHSNTFEPSSARLILTLGIAGFLSGVILVSVYLYTKPIIAQNKADALQAAIFEVLPQTDTFRIYTLSDGALELLGSEETLPEALVYEGLNVDGSSTGFAISGEEAGYQDIISAIFGFDPHTETIIGFKVLESKETPGLGDKIYKDDDFQANFEALATRPAVEVVKKGERSANHQIEAITGATISSNAIGRLINTSLDQWKAPITTHSITTSP
jgi:electron transport complex protein RnfG